MTDLPFGAGTGTRRKHFGATWQVARGVHRESGMTTLIASATRTIGTAEVTTSVLARDGGYLVTAITRFPSGNFYKNADETLAKNGFAPNRKPAQPASLQRAA